MNEITCRYAVVRFVPDPVRDEARNLGVLFQEVGSQRVQVRVAGNLRRRLASHSKPGQIGLVRAYLEGLAESLSGSTQAGLFDAPGPGAVLRDDLARLSSRLHGVVRFSEPAGVLTRDPVKEVDFLFRTFVGDEAAADHPGVKRSRLKTDLRREFARQQLLPRKQPQPSKDDAPRLQENVTIKSTHTHVDFTVDFACRNGHVLVIETVDLRKSDRERRHEAIESAFTLSELKATFSKKLRAYSVVAMPDDDASELRWHLKVLDEFSEVVHFDRDRERRHLLSDVKESVEGSAGKLFKR